MPLPSPRKKEDEKGFMSRCMGDDTMGEDFPNPKQRVAVCYARWDESKKKKKKSDGSLDFVVLD